MDHVVGALLRRADRVLLVHRSPARRWYPDVWDVPGGHVELGEDPAAALVRELGEEVGIDADVGGEPFARVGSADFTMDVWLLDTWSGEPVNAAPEEHDAIAWVTADDLDGLRLAPGVREQVERATTSRIGGESGLDAR